MISIDIKLMSETVKHNREVISALSNKNKFDITNEASKD